ncbi:hypothetical protein PIB30_072818 [Stylosanthes scabra]|uniref:Uncharacterized protein n=1 Tax=Stylosanthes scabra TaxID=79078 RepID=A0ABU6RQ08_9FABA|nr:hypothetical protein [Stylosanthes scabra]
MPILAGYGELTRSVIIANPTDPELALDNHRSYFPGGPISRPRSLKPRLVAGTLAGGPPAATVSRDVSLYPTWKQRPHSAYYSRWFAVAIIQVVSPAGPSTPRLTAVYEILKIESTRSPVESIQEAYFKIPQPLSKYESTQHDLESTRLKIKQFYLRPRVWSRF